MNRIDPEALAFAGAFSQAEQALGSDRSERAEWLRAYIACATGDLDRAQSLSAPLAEGAEDQRVRVRAAITLGSALRQAGRHREAAAQDRRAATLAVEPEERAHALIGLAADAVGAGDTLLCADRLEEARALGPVGPRAAIRLAWVLAEYALLIGRPERAAAHAREALDVSIEAGYRRHEAKSLLFLGAAQEAAGDPAATTTLADAQGLAARLGARSVAAVAAALRARAAQRTVP